MADNVDHTHGDTGLKPEQDLNFLDGDFPDPETFDWFWSEVPAAINDHADTIELIDSDEDGVVDEAHEADTVDGNHAADLADNPHGDGSHNLEYIHDGDGVKRGLWVIDNGADDPEGAEDEDIIMEKQPE